MAHLCSDLNKIGQRGTSLVDAHRFQVGRTTRRRSRLDQGSTSDSDRRDAETGRPDRLTERVRLYEKNSGERQRKGAAMSGLTDQIRHSVNNPLTSTDFDFTAVLDDVLSTVGLSVTDAGGNVRFYGGADPLIASPFLFASASAVALGAKGVAASAIWRERGGGDQDIAIDIRRAFQRFSGFGTGAGNRSTDGRRRSSGTSTTRSSKCRSSALPETGGMWLRSMSTRGCTRRP